jgi:hypothetical protein
MKIRELIKELEQFDQDLEVFVDGYEADYDTPVISAVYEFKKDVNTDWYYGKHIRRTGGGAFGIILSRADK